MNTIKKLNQIMIFLILSSFVGCTALGVGYQAMIYSKCGSSKEFKVISCDMAKFSSSLGIQTSSDDNSCWCASRM